MTKLSDTQAVILSAAAQRDDGGVLPLPETLKIKGGAVGKVLGSLKARGLIEHQGTPRGDDPPPLRITRAGLEAIGVEETRTTRQKARRRPTRARRRPRPESRWSTPRPWRPRLTVPPRRARGKTRAKPAKRSKVAPAGQARAPRRHQAGADD